MIYDLKPLQIVTPLKHLLESSIDVVHAGCTFMSYQLAMCERDLKVKAEQELMLRTIETKLIEFIAWTEGHDTRLAERLRQAYAVLRLERHRLGIPR